MYLSCSLFIYPVLYLNFNIIQDDATYKPYACTYTNICWNRDIGTDLFKKATQKIHIEKWRGKEGGTRGGGGGWVGEMWKDRKFKAVKDRKFLGCSLVKEVLIFSIGHLKNLCAWCTCKCLSKVKLARMLDNFEGHDSIFFALHWNPSFKISCVRHNYVSNINLFDPPLISSKLRVYQVCSNHPRTFTPNVFKLLGFTC